MLLCGQCWAPPDPFPPPTSPEAPPSLGCGGNVSTQRLLSCSPPRHSVNVHQNILHQQKEKRKGVFVKRRVRLWALEPTSLAFICSLVKRTEASLVPASLQPGLGSLIVGKRPAAHRTIYPGGDSRFHGSWFTSIICIEESKV